MTETAEAPAPPTVEQLLAANAGLVWKVARDLHRAFPAADLEDLHAEVRVGFVRAAIRFDHTRGTTFGAYAVRAGTYTGLDYLRREAARGVRVPSNGPLVRRAVRSLDVVPAGFDPDHAVSDGAMVPAPPDPDPDPDAGRLWEVVRRHLSGRQAAAVEWVYRHGRRLKDLAREWGVSHAAAGQWLKAGMARLRADPAAVRDLERYEGEG